MEPDGAFSLAAVAAWLAAEPGVESAVLFGSSARRESPAGDDGAPFDLDLHVVAENASAMERVDWRTALPGANLCLQALRPATGGVRKVTVVFAAGQIDLVVVPAFQMRLAALGLRLGLNRRLHFLHVALNEMATCLHPGYCFLKGERAWGPHYARVARLPGVRLNDLQVRELAGAFLADFLWVREKIERGELIAAQHFLHTRLVDTNLRLWREGRLRRAQALPSFGLGRRVEQLCSAEELKRLRVTPGSSADELRRAAGDALQGLRGILGEILPEWSPPQECEVRLARLASPASRLRAE